MKRKIIIFLICGVFSFNLFSQIPVNATETFHVKIEQENRLYTSIYWTDSHNDFTKWSEFNATNGGMLELSLYSYTISASYLTDHNKGSGISRSNYDIGYEFSLSQSLKLQPFAGCEINSYGKGLSLGAKLNKNINLFDYMSLGAYVGLRYSKVKDYLSINSTTYQQAGYISGSAGIYWLIYTYKRPKIIRYL